MVQNSLASVRFETYRIAECIDASEYNALTDGQKEKLQIILSCGFINMGEGSILRNQILTLFPDGTTTYANLMAILEYIPSPES